MVIGKRSLSRLPFVRHLPALITLSLIAVLMLRANPFVGETLAPFDLLVHQPAWRSVEPKPALVHFEHSDIIDSRLPIWRELRRALRAGEPGLWNPYPADGAPGIQLPTRGGLTPAFAVYALAPSEGLGLYLAALLNLLILGMGAYLFFWTLSGQRAAALFGAIVLSYSGFIAGWFYWPHVATAIWMPWLLLFGLRYLQAGERRWLPWFALVSALMLLGGFPIVFVYAYLALAMLGLARLLSLPLSWRERLSRIGELALFTLLSLLMVAFAVWTLTEYLGQADLAARHGGTAFTSLADLRLFVAPFSDTVLRVERSAYVGLFPVVALFVALYWAARRRADWRIAWALALIALSMVFVFALLPREWLARVPLIGTNPWSRMLLLIQLGLATLAVLLYQRLWHWARPRLSRPLFVALAAGLPLAQLADEGRVFTHRVAPVSVALNYPATPTIDAMRAGIGPLQSVIADRGFLVSGTLNAYGLPEWFAHELRPAAEKRTLERWLARNAFVTPTAARFGCDQVRFASPGMDYFGVRYIACTLAAPEQRLLLDTRAAGDGWSAPLGEGGLVQRFRIGARFHPQRFRITAPAEGGGDIGLTLLAADGSRLAATRCARQREAWECSFSSPPYLAPGDYRLRISVDSESRPGPRVGIAMLNAPGALIEQDGERRAGMLRMAVYQAADGGLRRAAREATEAGFQISEPEPGMRLYRNPRVTGGAYALGAEGLPDYRAARLVSAMPGHLVIDYLDDRPAWIVALQRHYPGWHASVDGRPAPLARFLDAMIAVPVDGAARIRLDYRPTGMAAMTTIALAAWLVWAVAAWRWR